MKYIKKFDPWNSPLCTCPFKWSFNPYTGCGHKCVYCYASTYIKRFFQPRPKRISWVIFEKEAKRIRNSLISISNSTDPYQPLEKELQITRKSLEILIKNNVRIQIVTKSNLVERDIDIIKSGKVVVAFTITTLKSKISKKLEPYAPSPKQRIKTAKKLIENGIPVVVRYDPIIPSVNENEKKLIRKLAVIGVRQLISSTLKIKPLIWQRLLIKFPTLEKKLGNLYFKEGEKIGSYWYLPRDLRIKILENVKKIAEKYGMLFSTCRENLSFLNSAPTCDGSWLTLKIKHKN